jgi:hypothetical protein
VVGGHAGSGPSDRGRWRMALTFSSDNLYPGMIVAHSLGPRSPGFALGGRCVGVVLHKEEFPRVPKCTGFVRRCVNDGVLWPDC